MIHFISGATADFDSDFQRSTALLKPASKQYEFAHRTITDPLWFTSQGMMPCPQFGRFVEAAYYKDSDIAVWVDADVTVQRLPRMSEVGRLLLLDGRQVMLGQNAGPDDRIMDEAARIGCTYPLPANYPCYNAGVMAARVGTWKWLASHVVERFPDLRFYRSDPCKHRALIQLVICLVLGEQDVSVIDMPQTMHLHNHFPYPANVARDSKGRVTVGGKPVLFLHTSRHGGLPWPA